MVIKVLGKDKMLSRLFSFGTGGGISMVIPKFFTQEMELGPKMHVEVFYNRKNKSLEIRKYMPKEGEKMYEAGDSYLKTKKPS
jgi:hypothetical protein